MTEYQEICNGKSIEELKEELAYQIDKLGFSLSDSFPQYLQEQIAKGSIKTFSITDGEEVIHNVTQTFDIRGYDKFVYRDKKGIIYRVADWKKIET